ncbi:MAG: AraC family transcriptional regulator [Eubacteriales bacterium]
MNLEQVRYTNRLRDYQQDVSVYLKEYRIPYMITPHLHTEYEIYYNISGGKGFFIDEYYYECNPHDLFIIRKMHIHRVAVGDPDNYVRCVISIDSTFIDKLRALFDEQTSLDFLDQAGSELPIKVHLVKEEHEKFLMHIKEYLRLQQSKDQLLLTAKLFEILAFIKYTFREKQGTVVPESEPESWSEKAIYYIERHFKECQTGDVAQALYINENYLSRLFKSETGTSLNNYIIQRRIAEAKKLLYNGTSVKDTCIASGVNDCSNFIRTFKKFTGMSPGTIKKGGERG